MIQSAKYIGQSKFVAHKTHDFRINDVVACSIDGSIHKGLITNINKGVIVDGLDIIPLGYKWDKMMHEGENYKFLTASREFRREESEYEEIEI